MNTSSEIIDWIIDSHIKSMRNELEILSQKWIPKGGRIMLQKAQCAKCGWKGGLFLDDLILDEVLCPRCNKQGFIVADGLIDTDVSTKRGLEFLLFTTNVLKHIETYTVPQYGDAPDDQIESWSAGECVRSIGKRVARFGRNAREGQEILDMLKIAHEACLAYFKLSDCVQPLNEEDVENQTHKAWRSENDISETS